MEKLPDLQNYPFQTRYVVIDFRCLINCGVKVIPSVKLSTESVCEGSRCSNITSYNWALYEQGEAVSNDNRVWRKRSDLQLMASTPLNSSAIVIKEDSLVGGKNYRLAVFVGTVAGQSGISAYDISTASHPSGGECSIQPASGISLETNFTLSCRGWQSNSEHLTYRFQYEFHNSINNVIYYGMNNLVVSQLPSGVLSENYTLNVTATVSDKDGASAPVVKMPVQVNS